MADQTITNAVNNNVNSDSSVAEWEFGLPSVDELTPLTQLMLPPELASAFSISPVPPRSSSDVTRASDSTISSIRSGGAPPPSDEGGVEDEDQDSGNLRQIDAVGDGDAGGDLVGEEEHGDSTNEEQRGGKTKRQRLVWTPQLHKRFVDVVGHLGIKNAVPKTIMQMMNVEGLTRENVASHLQKYRLYLKRMQDGGTTSATTPTMITSSEQQQGMTGLPYAPMPVYGGYHMMMQQQHQRDWGRSN